ncbi:RecX family transcriptional regulator [Candidatus Peregrinibacteria bacterium]|nr:RecX family transcriptional regulator [Candidatus Peregrinibacteria bacterium]
MPRKLLKIDGVQGDEELPPEPPAFGGRREGSYEIDAALHDLQKFPDYQDSAKASDARRQENLDRSVLACTRGSRFSDNAACDTFAKSYYEKLMQYAFHILSRKRYTVKEMRQKLVKYVGGMLKNGAMLGNKEAVQEPPAFGGRREESGTVDEAVYRFRHASREIHGAKLINEGVLRLEELGYLNDELYARDYLAQRIKLRPRGKILLRKELILKGIDKAIIEKGIFDSEIDEFELAKDLLLKKVKKLAKYDKKTQKSKAYTFLASRGFGRDAIYRAMESCYDNNASWD